MISTVMKFAATSALALGMLGGAVSYANAQPIDRSGSGQCSGQGGCIGDDIIEGPRGSSGGSREFLRDRAREDRREFRRDRDRDRDRREYRRDRDRSDYRDRRYRDRDRYSYYRDPYRYGSSYRYGSPSVVFEYSRPAYRTVVPVRPSYVRPGAYSSAHIDWCYARYRSYRASDNTFQPYNGGRRSCYSPYS